MVLCFRGSWTSTVRWKESSHEKLTIGTAGVGMQIMFQASKIFVLVQHLAFRDGKVPRDGGLPLAICRSDRVQASVCILR